MAGTLISLLHSSLPYEHGIPNALSNIISSSLLPPNFIAATSRVHNFSSDMQSSIHGYRPLNTLFNLGMEVPSSFHVDRFRELLAIRADHPTNLAFAESWVELGVEVKTNFIIIFLDDNTNNTTNSNAPIPRSISRSHSHLSLSTRSPSPYVSSGGPSSISILHSATNLPSQHSSRHSSIGGSHYHTRTPSPMSAAPANTADPGTTTMTATEATEGVALLPGTSGKMAAIYQGLSAEAIQEAQFAERSNKSLLSMLLNHRAMVHVLMQLGLYELRGLAFSSLKVAKYPGGLELIAQDVLREFGWSVDSFMHKCTWYTWAESAVTSQEWRGSPGTPSSLFLYNSTCSDFTP